MERTVDAVCDLTAPQLRYGNGVDEFVNVMDGVYACREFYLFIAVRLRFMLDGMKLFDEVDENSTGIHLFGVYNTKLDILGQLVRYITC